MLLPLQVLPFASEATLAQLEANIASCPSVTDMLHEGDDARAITARILAGLGVMDQGFSLTPRCAHMEGDVSGKRRSQGHPGVLAKLT